MITSWKHHLDMLFHFRTYQNDPTSSEVDFRYFSKSFKFSFLSDFTRSSDFVKNHIQIAKYGQTIIETFQSGPQH
eukprot:UN13199